MEKKIKVILALIITILSITSCVSNQSVETTDIAESTPSPVPTVFITILDCDPPTTCFINIVIHEIKSELSHDSETLSSVPYGVSVTGRSHGKWLEITYNDVTGYIYLGKTSDGRECVVYNQDDLQPLE